MSRPDFTNERLGILHGITINMTQEPTESQLESKRRRSSHSPEREDDDKASSEPPKTTRFRFKKKKRSRRPEKDDRNSSSKRRRHRRDYHAPLDDDPDQYDDSYIPNAGAWNQAADPDAAFRESLFDAMADDEGAAFWEGVYGQPIHVYERPEVRDERGELERMTDEVYARYVREKMWEKSHQHITEERERRERRREQRKQEEKEEQREWERRDRKRKIKEKSRQEQSVQWTMRKRWQKYAQHWETPAADSSNICWPVASGRTNDVTKESVEAFILAHPAEQTLQDVLKAERIRWHPDKAQQRWGREALTDVEMKAITTVFQTIDALWKARDGIGS